MSPKEVQNHDDRRQIPKVYNYTMTAEDGTIAQLEETVVEKDLGVVVDNTLTFSHHINSIVARANEVVGMIRYDTWTKTFL